MNKGNLHLRFNSTFRTLSKLMLFGWVLLQPTNSVFAQSPTGRQNISSPPISIWLLICSAAVFGGLLYGMKDKQLALPHRTSSNSITPGFLLDLLFGLAGGLIIFIVVPGNFDPQASGFELVRIIGVALLGGYGGRALVEKVLVDPFHKLEVDVKEIRDQKRQDTIAEALVIQHLDDDPDTPLISDKDIKKAILSGSSRAKLVAFNTARVFRRGAKPEELYRAIPIFEALIEADEENKYHRNHAQLGFIYKEKVHPDYRRAEEEFSIAIKLRDQHKTPGFRLYEYHRAICRIQENLDVDKIVTDLNIVLADNTISCWVRDQNEADGLTLHSWFLNHSAILHEWLRINQINIHEMVIN